MIEMVQAGQVAPNERLLASNLPGDTANTITPLCALIGTVAGASAVNTLLNRGADVNMPCSARSDGLPLDIVMDTAALRGAIDSPFRVNKQYRPEHIPTYLGYAERLVGMGGRSRTGPMTMADVKQRIRESIEASDRMIPGQIQSYNEIVESRNALLKGVGVVAGTMVAAKVLSDRPSMASAAQSASRLNPGLASAAPGPVPQSGPAVPSRTDSPAQVGSTAAAPAAMGRPRLSGELSYVVGARLQRSDPKGGLEVVQIFERNVPTVRFVSAPVLNAAERSQIGSGQLVVGAYERHLASRYNLCTNGATPGCYQLYIRHAHWQSAGDDLKSGFGDERRARESLKSQLQDTRARNIDSDAFRFAGTFSEAP
ncbi:hypothetical protein [Hydrogenophaga sp.]|uniref:hypothetical protein n=1 Tax=Hydrogenophaga sp. TaxID=1904254 RepID=UPI00261794B1|nr:hypothetical protein [Hydrogenophaga sp.]MCW5653689.1 hypothetical protein [Hydrogenophaga sp.]